MRPEQFVAEAVEGHLGESGTPGSAWEPVREGIRSLIFDGSLRKEIDAAIDDPELRVS